MSTACVLSVLPAQNDRLREACSERSIDVVTAPTVSNAVAQLIDRELPIACVVLSTTAEPDNVSVLVNALLQSEQERPCLLVGREGESQFVVDEDMIETVDFEEGHDIVPTICGWLQKQDVIADQRTHTVPTDAEIAHAVDSAPIGVSITDPSQTDNPLVYVNETWTEMSGYETETLLGKNARVLQGPETDTETVTKIRHAVANNEPITTVLKNYRKDGTSFWNELTLAPVFDANGTLQQYVGFQNDVTERKRAEALARDRTTELAAERAVLDRILTRIDGLFELVVEALIEETTREAIERRICRAVVEADGCSGSWIACVDSEALHIATTSGYTVEGSQTVSYERLSEPIVTAIESTTATLVSGDLCTETPIHPQQSDGEQLLLVPLHYAPKEYGVLGIHIADADLVDDRELTLFESLGAIIATGLHIVETARMWTTNQINETTFKIEDESFLLNEIAAHIGTDVEYLGVGAGSQNGCYELYLTLCSQGCNIDQLTALTPVSAVRRIDEGDGRTTVALTMATTAVFSSFADENAHIVQAHADGATAEVVVTSPVEQDVRSIYTRLTEVYTGVSLRAQKERENRNPSPPEFQATVRSRLTDRQQTAIESAHLNGYFEWPRSVDGDDLAATMDISRQTFHQHLRAAEKKIVDAYLDE
ncbi:bacterio-opsin activator domain-containing protein [Natronocalculus amylovorans]|uniref:Helix-turn-helix domain-containing protein n=1 Tax=Natronocalculus amylovorans TaxID=2917812 RepID=A0AAE3FTZ7_9EURY|nr:bacterio-opsin activator domain-containing protein [Natronocalculus amylovorans]MCL9815567.1 helix-turn-helix domain-containing protein [Natronocalculus amylovorans]